MFTDERRRTVWDQLRQCDLRAFSEKLTPDLFLEAAAAAGVKIGVSALCLPNMVWLSLSLALRPLQSFTTVLTFTLHLLRDLEDWSSRPIAKAQRAGHRRGKRRKTKRSKHDPRTDDPTVVSEEAFAKARQAMPMAFWTALIVLLAGRFEKEHRQKIRWKRFRILAIDGTLINMDNHKALADRYGTARNGNGKSKGKGKTPQARMVMLQFPAVRMPLAYEVCPLDRSEKTVAANLLSHLRRNDLLLMDRGFWSYGLFCGIQKRNAYFGVRRFKTAKLKTIKSFSSKDRLVWYAPSDRKWRKQRLPTGIKLRVIDYCAKGFRPSQIVTNALDPKEISRDEWIRMAKVDETGEVMRTPGLYHRRWEIEITYLEIKDVQGMERTLRSRTPRSIEYELAGQVLLYLLIRWMMVEAATAHGVADPLRLSFTGAVRELTDMIPKILISSERHIARTLLPTLLRRIADHRVPLRPGRHYPRPNDTKVKNKGKGRRQRPSKLPSSKVEANTKVTIV